MSASSVPSCRPHLSAYALSDHPVGRRRAHKASWPLALDRYEEGMLDGAAVTAIRTRLLDLGLDSATLRIAADAGVSEGFLDPATVALFE